MQEKYDQALIQVNNAIEVNPDFIELWIYLGFIAIEKQDYVLAEHAFAEAAYRDGDLAQIYYLLGAVAETQAQEGEAYRYREEHAGIDGVFEIACPGVELEQLVVLLWRFIDQLWKFRSPGLDLVKQTGWNNAFEAENHVPEQDQSQNESKG